MTATGRLVRVQLEPNEAGPPWARGGRFSVPEEAWAGLRSGARPELAREAAEALRLRAAFTGAPLSSRLPVSYQRVPPRIRSLIAGVLGRIKRLSVRRWGSFPAWPLDLSADFVADLGGAPPAGESAPVVLSHDLDSPEGLRSLVDRFLPVEEGAIQMVGSPDGNMSFNVWLQHSEIPPTGSGLDVDHDEDPLTADVHIPDNVLGLEAWMGRVDWKEEVVAP